MLLKLYEKNNNPADLQQVIDLLNDGGILIYPTDTMYAIGCHGLKERAIERICRLKDIDPKKNNLSIICYDLSKVSEYAKVDNSTFKLMKRNLPGAFTFILNGTTRLPKIFRNRKEVGIRMPDNSIIQEIARLLDAPIMTTTLPHDDNEDIEYCTDRFGNRRRYRRYGRLYRSGLHQWGAGNHTPGVRLAGRRINIEFRPQFPNLFNFFYVSLLRNTGTL